MECILIGMTLTMLIGFSFSFLMASMGFSFAAGLLTAILIAQTKWTK